MAKKTLQESKKHDPELNQVYGKLLQEVYFLEDVKSPVTKTPVYQLKKKLVKALHNVEIMEI